MRLRLTVAYVGTRYQGWQLQAGSAALQTIQGQLEQALGLLAGQPVRVHGSGRTDAGVHAEGQVAHCDMPDERLARLKDLRHSLNALLPDDIRVFAACPAPSDFHARFSAHAKTYRYQFWQDQGFVPPRLVPYVWCSGPLDVARMRGALPFLQGRHDFAFLANAGSKPGESTIRELYHLDLAEEVVWQDCSPLLSLEVTGSGFLKQMVRNLAGLLAAIGRNRLEAAVIPELMAQGERRRVPTPTAPAKGLTMVCVDYEGSHKSGAGNS